MNWQPQVRAVRRRGDEVELDLFVPASLPFFPDHFPRLGILPGVVQLDWAIGLGREHLGLDGTFRGLRNLKFQNPVLADTALTLRLSRGDGGDLAFSFAAGERPFSSGRAVFGAAA